MRVLVAAVQADLCDSQLRVRSCWYTGSMSTGARVRRSFLCRDKGVVMLMMKQ